MPIQAWAVPSTGNQFVVFWWRRRVSTSKCDNVGDLTVHSCRLCVARVDLSACSSHSESVMWRVLAPLAVNVIWTFSLFPYRDCLFSSCIIQASSGRVSETGIHRFCFMGVFRKIGTVLILLEERELCAEDKVRCFARIWSVISIERHDIINPARLSELINKAGHVAALYTERDFCHK